MSESLYGLAVPPLIIGFIKVLEMTGVPKRLLPLTSILVGLLIGLIYYPDWREGALVGVWYGLAAIGLQSGTAVTLNGSGKNGNGKPKE